MPTQGSPCNVEEINSAFLQAVPFINTIIANKTRLYKAIYRDLIPRGVFEYGQGYTKYNETFYGGLAIQDAGASWSTMAPYRAPGTNGEADPGHDPCKYQGEVISYGFEQKEYTVYEANRRTLDICLTDIMFDWQFEKQLSLIYQSLSNVTLGEWEQITREIYLSFCNKYWAQENVTGTTWGLEPLTMNMFSSTIAIPATGLGTVGRLNQSVLDRCYQWLSRQAPEGALSMDGGMPIFGLITSMETSTEVITQDQAEVMAHLYGNPDLLLEGYGKVKQYKGFAHILAPDAPRFKVSDDGANLERVWPYTAAATFIGNAINVNQDYIRAPFEMSVIFLKRVYTALVPPANPAKLAQGYSFDPVNNFGEFDWLNIQERCENPRREKGFFAARMRIAPEPDIYSTDAVAILHRRCDLLDIVECGECAADTDIKVVSCAQFDETESASAAVKYIVELEACLPCQVGQLITVTYNDSSTACATIADDWGSPFYVIIFDDPMQAGCCLGASGITTMNYINCGCTRQ